MSSLFKNDILQIMFFFWKVTMWNLVSLKPWRNISILELENRTAKDTIYYCKHEGLISNILTPWYYRFVLISIVA